LAWRKVRCDAVATLDINAHRFAGVSSLVFGFCLV
jgi:hypothetical protein